MNFEPQGRKILVVDDEANILKSIRHFLVYKGFQVITALDGEEAVRKTHSMMPDLIILDIMLPKMDGYAVCQLLKNDGATRRIPIVMLTSRSEPTDVSAGYERGADIYFVKPVNLEGLSVTIEKLLLKAARDQGL
jgi:DNA-binding response OmpR family regulator